MPRNELPSLWSGLQAGIVPSRRFFAGFGDSICLDDLAQGSSLGGRIAELRGRSVAVLAADQLAASLAFLELDGVARRIVLVPPDLATEHLPFVFKTAEIDAIVSDRAQTDPAWPEAGSFVTLSTTLMPRAETEARTLETEWVLLTSGTTGQPKLVAHTLATLAGAIPESHTPSGVVWSTFYDIRRYGGLQILLRAIRTGASMVFSDGQESPAAFLDRAGARGVTHISGTPSHWRRALMSQRANSISPQYVRLSGEIADQAILNQLRVTYPEARIVHAFATTEAGLSLEVHDLCEGFPSGLVGVHGEVEMKIEGGSLRVRSPRMAKGYLGETDESLAAPDGFVDTRDMLELRGDRYYFVGRRDGVINIGGQKVHPEEVEAVINRHPLVRMSLVRARKSPVTGAIVVADVVLADNAVQGRALQEEILMCCRKELAPHKVPATIKFVPELAVSDAGKLTRATCAT